MAKSYEELRKALGMNQNDMAKLIGISYRSYQNRLSGEYPTFLDELVKICEASGKNCIKIEAKQGTYEIKIKNLKG